MANEIDELKKEINDLKAKLQTEHKAPTSEEVKSTSSTLQSKETKNFEEHELYSWDAPVRIFKKWERNSGFTLAVLGSGGLCLILIALQEYMLAGTIIILTVLCIILAVIPPLQAHHKITNKGVVSLGKLYLWDDLDHFWIAERKGNIIMYIETKLHYPGRLFFIIPLQHVQSIVNTLNPYIKYLDRHTHQDIFSTFSEGKYIHFNDIKNLTPSI